MSKLPVSIAALGAIVLAVGPDPVAAQTIYYEDGAYLYAVPNANGSVVQDDDVALPREVPDRTANTAVRTIPARSAGRPTPIVLPAEGPTEQLPMILPAYGAGFAQTPGTDYAVQAQGTYAGVSAYDARSSYLPNGAQLVAFDREAWLAECSYRLSAYDETDRGRVIGALAGAALGGFAGNRIGAGNRLGGTLLGAGAGAAAGAAIGDSIDDRADRRARRSADAYCANYLEDYMARASNHGVTMTTYIPGQQYMLVPVSVPVAQQVVYREYGTQAD